MSRAKPVKHRASLRASIVAAGRAVHAGPARACFGCGSGIAPRSPCPLCQRMLCRECAEAPTLQGHASCCDLPAAALPAVPRHYEAAVIGWLLSEADLSEEEWQALRHGQDVKP